MISPSIIVSLGWEDYEYNVDDLEYMETLGEFAWHSDELEDPRCYSEYYLASNEDIFSMLEERGDFICNKYYSLGSQHYDSMEEYCYWEDTSTHWEEEYELFCEQQTSYTKQEDLEFDSKFDLQQQQLIKRKDKINNKRKKHNKDKLSYEFRYKNFYKCTCERCQMGKQHKHLRAQKVYYEQEETWDNYYFSHFDWEDYYNTYQEYYDEDEPLDWDAPWTEICGHTLSYNDWLDEVGSTHLRSDFDWSDYVDETGKVLESWEIRNKEVEESTRAWSCEYCGQVVCACDVWEV